MTWALARAIVILPGTVLVLVPALLVWSSAGTAVAAVLPEPGRPSFWLGAAIGAFGLALAVWTVRLLTTRGEGTPAPWDPPRPLVVRGPCQYVRNPMISAVLALLLAEALLFRSWPIAAWMAVFFLANAIYFPWVEEPGLERRFGAAYQAYRANVPRWLPRPTAWRPDRQGPG